jgi:hypothetical protein
MKNKTLILAFLILSAACMYVSAQTGKGTFLIGELYKPGGYGDGQITSMNIG